MLPLKFEDLVKRYADETPQRIASEAVGWEERKVWWQGKVVALLDEIEVWLAPLIQSGAIVFNRLPVKLNEETLGSYEIESAKIQLGGQTLQFRPVGSVIVGAFGRIDVVGPVGEVMLVLCPPDETATGDQRRASSVWFISHPQRRSALMPLNRGSFEQLFTDLFGIDG